MAKDLLRRVLGKEQGKHEAEARDSSQAQSNRLTKALMIHAHYGCGKGR
jgi:hypothetical protein